MNILNVGFSDCAGVMAKWKSIFDKYSTTHTMRNLIESSPDYYLDEIDLFNNHELKQVIDNTDIFLFHIVIKQGHLTTGLINDGVGSNICGINWQEVVGDRKVYAILNGSTNLRHFSKEYSSLIPKLYSKVFCTTPDLALMFPFARFLPVPLDINSPKYSPVNCRMITGCLHFPTDKPIKNTAEYLRTMEKVKSQFPTFVYRDISRMDNREVMQLKKHYLFCFDHFQGYYGVNSLEAASVGCIPLVNVAPENKQMVMDYVCAEDVPFEIVRNEDELFNSVKYYLENKGEALVKSVRCREWMEKYWCPKLHLDKFEKLLEGNKKWLI